MSLLTITNLTIRIAGRTLLDDAALTIAPGQHIGLVGRNGVGKSTLLRAIGGEISPDGGDIRLASRARLGWVHQEAPADSRTPHAFVLSADTERADLLAAEATAPPTQLADIHERLRIIGADSAPARAASILAGLGFDITAQARPLSDFSGGWRMRVALAASLFAAPDLLLLDEPSNHLDLDAALWLESWLTRFQGAALIVSHDRGLLDHAVAAIAHLDQGKISLTPGGYEDFVRIRTERALQTNREAERVAANREKLQGFIDRFRAKATKARQAQARIKALQRLPVVTTVIEAEPMRLTFPEPLELAPPLLTLRNVFAGYDNVPVLRDLSLRIDPEDRIALLGANGQGKSTFARLLAGRLAPLSGEITRAARMSIGYFAQHQAEELRASESPLAHLRSAAPHLSETLARAQLARFGLDVARADTPVASLSGGERARLLLALATRAAPSVLILDEPSNHLDLDARDALVRALAAFPGAVILISHDPHLVELIADQLWLVADGKVQPFDGDLDDYRAQLAARATEATAPSDATQARRTVRRERAEARAALAPLRQRIRAAEQRAANCATLTRGLEAKLADPALYAAGGGNKEIAELTTRLAAARRAQQTAEEEWLLATEALELAEA